MQEEKVPSYARGTTAHATLLSMCRSEPVPGARDSRICDHSDVVTRLLHHHNNLLLPSSSLMFITPASKRNAIWVATSGAKFMYSSCSLHRRTCITRHASHSCRHGRSTVVSDGCLTVTTALRLPVKRGDGFLAELDKHPHPSQLRDNGSLRRPRGPRGHSEQSV